MAQHSDETILDEAKSLLVQGKRFMALEDFQSATDHLEQACQLFDSYYGVAKPECADAYLEYGLALVALANLEAGSGTDKLMKKAGIDGEVEGDDGEDGEGEGEDEGDDEEEEGEDEEEDKDKDENAEAQDAAKPQSSSDNIDTEMKTADSQTNGTSKSEVETQSMPQSSSSDPQPGTSNGKTGDDKDDDNEENDEPTTIEVAWEVLCLAKRLYMTDESLEGRMKLAETLQKIGEISIEWDNNDNAVSILEECLKIRSAILPPEDRLIALTYYHLGLAHSFKSDTQNANENFQKAIEVIEKRIASLSKDLAVAESNQDTLVINSYKKEINELKELLPDMTMRLDDSKEDGEKSAEVLKRTREEAEREEAEAKKVCLDSSKPVDDISYLVKRKAA